MTFEYDPTEIVPKVVQVLKSFSQHIRKPGSEENFEKVLDAVQGRIKEYIAENAPITMVLPAFPWKNPNLDKVLGPDPDLGEELGLSRLNDICQEISKFYIYGARLLLICDVPVYNDLVGIPDDEAYDYGLRLRQLAQEKKFSSIQFLRSIDLMGLGDGEKISRSDYLESITMVREKLMSSDYFDQSFNIETELEANPDTKATFDGFFSRISEDLKWGKGIDVAVVADQVAYDAEVARVVKVMIQRLIAYEKLISVTLGEHIRLSIHPSIGKNKISIPLLPHAGKFGDMPWHASVVVLCDGDIMSGDAKDFRDHYDVVMKDGRPYYFRERNPLYEWSVPVYIQHSYKSLLFKNPGDGKQILQEDDRLKLARCIVLHKGHTVHVEGFAVPEDQVA
ncbi:conserved hypothetical protein [Talaromyces stipitatus ATCC 10500]|uniref:Pyoverdine/dityrosine biosynthesis protein n=1 Tax=Talaromyces stipitatus (strain ATCC 10500 / CBS 375.48 / QM 6759 / NRRL 1006) TaxID=441959 RepID=B8LYB4_TALSN|nr:uncharacterized protein TSTA_063250 [Talaromyces stipitatus ATCC 10500]EED22843.1 conserved hypothetical protein [Talaromyces stipitatus ATCC 10500]